MIPKVIHYCWFGGKPLPDEFCKYIESWKKYCPDFEIKRWDESNFDIDCCAFTRKAFDEKKWAFLSDYARLWIVYHEGGFYLDTDVELIQPLDWLAEYKAWFACEGNAVATGLGFGAEQYHGILKENMRLYEEMTFSDSEKLSVFPCPFYTTQVIKHHFESLDFNGKTLLVSEGVALLENGYCNPYDWATQKLRKKSYTISIHHYSATWQSDGEKKNNIERHNYERLSKKYGNTIANIYSFCFWSKKENGGTGILRTVFARILR